MKKPKFTQAFTLIELITVMVILMIIASLIVGVGSTARKRALETKAESMIAALEVAISMYHVDTGEYPAQNDQNATLVSNLKTDPWGGATGYGWRGPYMEFRDEDMVINEVVDPWGNAYNYDVPPYTDDWGNLNSFNLWSNGPDTNDDSSDGDTDYGDDIYNW